MLRHARTCLALTVSLGNVFNTTLADNGGPIKTHALVATCPARDRYLGAAYNALLVDRRAISRPQRRACDGGAYELVTPSPRKTGSRSPT